MQKYILNRLLQGVVLLFIVALIVFALARATGNPADLMVPPDATEEERQFIERNLGLDRPYHVQLFLFLSGAIRGDFGNSIAYSKPALELFFERLPNTLKLPPLSMLIAVGFGIPLGVIAAINRGTWIDQVAGAIAVFGVATPNFWIAIVCIYIFSVWLDVLPAGRMGGPAHYILPALSTPTEI